MKIQDLMNYMQISVALPGWIKADDEVVIQTVDGVQHPVIALVRDNGAEEYLPTPANVPSKVIISI